jgi:polyhydroxybutyrate depolymerase
MKRTLFASAVLLSLVFACSSSSSGGGGAGGTDAGPLGSDGGPGVTEGGSSTDAAGGGVKDAAASADTYNVTSEKISVSGSNRTYTLSVPKNYDASKSYPVVLVFHGDGGNGAGLRSYFFFEAASGTDAIVVYPDGQNATWDLYDPDPNNPDFDFIASLITKLAGSYNVDKSRVYGTGWSNGAFFINELACNRPHLLAAIAPNSGGAPGTDQQNWPLHYPNGDLKCIPGEVPIAALVVQGAVDGTVTKDSGQYDAQYWANVNGCAGTTSAVSPSPCTQYDGCPAGLSVVYCEIPTLGHGVWQNTATAAWAFFSAQK